MPYQAVYEGEGWVSVGFSSTGDMVVGDAVIGLPDNVTALEYDMTAYVSFDHERTTDRSFQLVQVRYSRLCYIAFLRVTLRFLVPLACPSFFFE